MKLSPTNMIQWAEKIGRELSAFRTISDAHFGAPHSKARSMGALITYTKEKDIHLNDNIDMRNLRKKDIHHYKKLFTELWNKVSRSKLCYMVLGNHDRKFGHTLKTRNGNAIPQFVIIDGVLFHHGYLADYSKKRQLEWSEGDNGISTWKWKLRSYAGKLIPHWKDGTNLKPSKKLMKKLENYVLKMEKESNLKIHTSCCGHWHPKEMFDYLYNNRRYIIVPRGVTNIIV